MLSYNFLLCLGSPSGSVGPAAIPSPCTSVSCAGKTGPFSFPFLLSLPVLSAAQPGCPKACPAPPSMPRFKPALSHSAGVKVTKDHLHSVLFLLCFLLLFLQAEFIQQSAAPLVLPGWFWPSLLCQGLQQGPAQAAAHPLVLP